MKALTRQPSLQSGSAERSTRAEGNSYHLPPSLLVMCKEGSHERQQQEENQTEKSVLPANADF